MKKLFMLGVTALTAIFVATGCTSDAPKEEATASTSKDTSAPVETKKEDVKPQKTEFKVGESIELDGHTLVVKSVEETSKSLSSIPPDEGYNFIVVNVEFTNTGKENFYYSADRFKMQNGDMQIVDPQFSIRIGKGALKHGELAPGGKASGIVLFQATPEDNKLMAIYRPQKLNTDIKIHLQ